MINKDEIKQISDLVNSIRILSYRKHINPDLFFLMFQCLCRTPLGSIEKIKSILSMIRMLVENGMDYNLLLKAGILTGKFPDYQYEKKKNNKKRQTKEHRQKEKIIAEAELKEIQKKFNAMEMDINDVKTTITRRSASRITSMNMDVGNGMATISIYFHWLENLYHTINSQSKELIEKKYRTQWANLSIEVISKVFNFWLEKNTQKIQIIF